MQAPSCSAGTVLQVTPCAIGAAAAAGAWSPGTIDCTELAVDALSIEMKRAETAARAIAHLVLRARKPLLLCMWIPQLELPPRTRLPSTMRRPHRKLRLRGIPCREELGQEGSGDDWILATDSRAVRRGARQRLADQALRAVRRGRAERRTG